MSKAVYIGPNTDIIPVLLLKDIKEFIYIDSLPQSQYGIDFFESGESYSSTFLSDLDTILINNNFNFIKSTDNYLEYKNPTQTLKYFINTPFPEKINDNIKKEIYNCDSLIIAGFNPNKIILELMPNLKNIYCNMHTVYCHDNVEIDSTFYELSNINKYNIFLLREKEKNEYLHFDIKPEIINKFDIIKCNYFCNFFIDYPYN